MATRPAERTKSAQTTKTKMVILLDADVVIRWEKSRFDLAHWVSSRPDDQFELSAITVAELWHGVERATGSARLKRENYLSSILSALPIIPYTEQTAFEHARIWADLESAGKMIGYYDVIVAATALARGSAVATFNKKHFGMVRGLSIVVPQ